MNRSTFLLWLQTEYTKVWVWGLFGALDCIFVALIHRLSVLFDSCVGGESGYGVSACCGGHTFQSVVFWSVSDISFLNHIHATKVAPLLSTSSLFFLGWSESSSRWKSPCSVSRPLSSVFVSFLFALVLCGRTQSIIQMMKHSHHACWVLDWVFCRVLVFLMCLFRPCWFILVIVISWGFSSPAMCLMLLYFIIIECVCLFSWWKW